MKKDREQFEFTYSAEQQAEIEKIRNKYITKEDDKLTQLRNLDESVTKKGTIIGITLGIAGCLLLGSGLSLVLVIGSKMVVASVLLGVPGIAAMVGAYPLYKKVTDSEMERIAPQILALTEELGLSN